MSGIDCKKTTCRERQAPPGKFDRRSFRMKRLRGGVLLVIGCPKGKWNKKTRRCRVGTRVQSIVRPMRSPRCRVCRR